MMKRSLLLTAFATFLCVPAQAQVSAIAGAVTAAIPLIQKVAAAIFPTKPQNAQNAASTASKALSSGITTGVSNIQKISTELKTIDDFVLNCSVADRDVADMVSNVANFQASATSKIEDLQFTLTHDFTEVKDHLKNLSNDGAAVQSMDTETAKVLSAIVDANNGLLDQINGDIAALGKVSGAFPALKSDLDKLAGQLSDGMSIAGITIVQVAQGLDQIATQGAQQGQLSTSGKNPPPPPPPPDNTAINNLKAGFASHLQQRYKSLSDFKIE